MLLYDLTSTYFESNPPENPDDMRRFGYSRDKRSECVQVTLHGEAKGQTATLAYQLDRRTLRVARRREGRYLLRTNMTVSESIKM